MDWLFEQPSSEQANHWLAILSLVLFAIGVVATGVISTRPSLPPFDGRYTKRFVVRACTIIGWICGAGLFFGIIRMLQIDPGTLGRPIWIVLTWIALAAAIGWIIYRAPADREQRRRNEERMRQRQARKPSRNKGNARA